MNHTSETFVFCYNTEVLSVMYILVISKFLIFAATKCVKLKLFKVHIDVLTDKTLL